MKKNKLIIAIIAVLLMGVIVSGGSFAYFVWSSGEGDRSTVNITIEQSGITMHIETEEKVMGGLRPTRNCNNANAYVDATVTVVNNTGAAAVPSLKVKARVIKGGSGDLTQEALSHIKYSVVNPGDSCDQIMTHDTKSTESTTNQDLLFMNASSWSTQLSFQSVATDGSWSHIPSTGNSMFNNTTTSIGTLISSPAYLPRQYYLKDNSDASFKKGDVNGITFVAAPHTTTTHQFRVYVWIDEEYTSTTIGNVISDPLQNAQIEINFSEQSIIQQVSSDSISNGAANPNSKAAGIYEDNGEFIPWDTAVANGIIRVNANGVFQSLFHVDYDICDYCDEGEEPATIELVIPYGITGIGDWALDSDRVTKLTIPNSVTSIGNYAVSDTSLYRDDSVIYQGTIAQWNAISFGETWNYLDSNGEFFITKVICSDGEITVSKPKRAGLYDSEGNYTSWDELVSSGKITLDTNKTYIDSSDKTMTGELVIPEGITVIGSVFYDTSLTSIAIPNSVTSIESLAFASNSLEEITIGENSQLRYISDFAFQNTNITSIELPSSLISMGENIFGFSSVTEVLYRGTMAQWDAITFYEESNEEDYNAGYIGPSISGVTIICSDGTIEL